MADNTTDIHDLLVTLGWDPVEHKQKFTDTLKNKKLVVALRAFKDQVNVTEKVDRSIGTLLFDLATRFPAGAAKHRPTLAAHIFDGSMKALQLDAAIVFFKDNNGEDFDVELFKKSCGIGVFPTQADIEAALDAIFKEKADEIAEKRYHSMPTINHVAREKIPFGDRKVIVDVINAKLAATLGPKTDADKAPPKAAAKAPKAKPAEKPKESSEEGRVAIQESVKFPDPKDNKQLRPDILEKHLAATGGKVVTRFPPEPNGYLHLGHAKAMALDYGYAKKMGGMCYMRFDDTNPEAESQEYIDSILDTVKWMGHKWTTLTHAADYFDQLYALAVELIKRDKAFVCQQTPEEVAASREKREPSPYRNRPVEESLKMFADMKDGKYKEGEVTLRMKMDYKSPNPCMWDLVAYRIKYHPHPHTGDKWCIYPSYDFTHCLNDSLENITHSLCTLEFGPRRESYNWLIDALELYRPVVWEFGRLNLTYTVLSKRKLIRLVNDGIVKGWDDPRMPTIVGVRRRGYTADAINNFCEAIGVTRSDTVMIEYSVLEEHVRDNLNEHAVRAMAVVDPIKVTIANWDKGAIKVERPNIPEKEAGVNNVSFTGTCWIDRADFKETDVKDYFGLALNTSNGKPKWVRLRYATVVRVLEAKKDDTGKIVELIAEYDKENAVKKPSGTIHWVSEPETGKTPVKVELRLYSPLFKSRNPSEVEDWLNDINPDSLKVVHAIADETVKGFKVGDVVQFERVGYFCVDKDSTADNIVLNRTVTLKESKLKPK